MRCFECKNWFELDIQSGPIIKGRCGVAPKVGIKRTSGFLFHNKCQYPKFFERANTKEYENRLRFIDQNCNIFEESK